MWQTEGPEPGHRDAAQTGAEARAKPWMRREMTMGPTRGLQVSRHIHIGVQWREYASVVRIIVSAEKGKINTTFLQVTN